MAHVLFTSGVSPCSLWFKILSASEQTYAQIKKELMAIVFACEKFDQYIYGQPVKVVKIMIH